ncbi:gpmA [Symbiodinium sp. CCMP2456]|nr:gpmA [Symbiodinium sp. CCMP2456]
MKGVSGVALEPRALGSNSLRALCKELEGLSEEKAMELVVAPGVPLVVELSESLEFVQKYYLMDDSIVKERLDQAENNED